MGGAEVAIQEITSRMHDLEFHLVTLRFDRSFPRKEKIGNVHVYRIGFGSSFFNKVLYQLYAPLYALALHTRMHFDCVWAVMAHSAGIPAALFTILSPRIPYVLTLQEGDPPERIERAMFPVWPLFARAFTRADVVTAISTFLGSWATRRGCKNPPLIIPNGVAVAQFSQEYSEHAVNEIKDMLGKRMGDVFLVTTSRLVEKNGIDDCIAALARLPDNVKFIVLGVGPLENELKRQAHKLHVETRVQFVGQIEHRELPKYLKACDIFIRPSRSEGMGNSFIEAMAAGLPVIATQEGGIADFLFDEKKNPDTPVTGFAVEKNDPDDIARQVKYVMNHPEKVRAVVATARTLVKEKYDWDLIARTMREKVFAQLLQDA